MSPRSFAMVVLKEIAWVSAGAVIAKLSEIKGTADYQAPNQSENEIGRGFVITSSSDAYTVLFVSNPMPAGTMDVAVANCLTWKTAGAELVQHRAHVIVAPLTEPSSPEGHRKAAEQVFLIAAALSSLLPAIGLYWPSAETVTEAAVLPQLVARLLAGGYPMQVWVGFEFTTGDTLRGVRMLGGFTRGLGSFVGREIALIPAPASPRDVATWVYGIASHLIDSGPIFADGSHIDIESGVRLLCRLVDTQVGPAYHLSLDPSSSRTSRS